ncbi:hypothetical protein Sta7437_0325 [Stanieria cyanosphaera PCC 7437]|uniref:Transposase n=1 Tax=Stanieria cyanosphaera (strain ATCC 29371 / PCC 7437) TaxID=111780 RepID=K9XQJ6_STAC7|nr:hypothetical protein [Stanieria cyanosphaera]AFZ33937.1 hypothetical protein Sta7437_0325 [Stanieria cyanosphaera PCC 7437]
MSPKKLTKEDKQEILNLYRHSEATTSTLATRYGVSSSTISRFLKNNLSATEYEDLIQQKRLARTPGKTDFLQEQIPIELDQQTKPDQTQKNLPIINHSETIELEKPPIKISATAEETDFSIARQDKFDNLDVEKLSTPTNQVSELEQEIDDANMIALGEMFGDDIADLDDLEDEDDDLEDDEEDWESETETERQISYPYANSGNAKIKILPLSAASFPKICYIVVDRSAELIARPLENFADLGKIPKEEFQQQTLPIFDNHRVARRFSHRRERVIKVPDGRMLQKTSHYLQAKGITRLLIDGQIYSLSTT